MDSSAFTRLTKEFEHAILAQIPLARTMQLSIQEYNADSLTLAAPLTPNINDKGCAFGGSLASLMTLAGWGLIALKLKSVGHNCDVFVQDSMIRYHAPVWEDFTADARLAADESWDAFFVSLNSRGRARLRIVCRVPLADGRDAVTFEARFVANDHAYSVR